MCTKAQLNVITTKIAEAARELLGNKLDNIWLYGSYARGTFDSESDIDIMILANISAEEANQIDRRLIALTSELGLEYDVLISLYVKDCATFNEWKEVLPFYQAILRDGVKLSA